MLMKTFSSGICRIGIIGDQVESSCVLFNENQNLKLLLAPDIISVDTWGGKLRNNTIMKVKSTSFRKYAAFQRTDGVSCDDLVNTRRKEKFANSHVLHLMQASCIVILQELQAEKVETLSYNFILGGQDLIFQGRSFDWNGACKSS